VLAPHLARDLVARLALGLGDALQPAAEEPLLGRGGADDELERARPVAGAI